MICLTKDVADLSRDGHHPKKIFKVKIFFFYNLGYYFKRVMISYLACEQFILLNIYLAIYP